ncbi:MAG: hypothetical protein FJ086_04595 [Deltaproteobacteria bacterium]|nr:hypothetical protein [Deltaproteobacteria bacterium]
MSLRIPLLAALLLSAPALAESDWFASLYTGEGVELRADERVFTLFSLLNANGFDDAPVTRLHPAPRRLFHPVRQQVRARVLSGDGALREQAQSFFDAHPVPLDRYLAYTLQSSPPPFATGAKGKDLQDLKGLEGLLKTVHAGWTLQDALAQAQGEYRRALRPYLAGLDEPLLKLRATLKVPEDGPSTLVVMNLLDAQGAVRGSQAENEIALIVGPSEKPNLEGLLAEYARVVLEPQVSRKAESGWGNGAALLREAQLSGAAEKSVGAYAVALLSRAAALRALGAQDAAWDQAATQGYFGLKDLARGFDDGGKPLDTWMLDALARVEPRKPAVKK